MWCLEGGGGVRKEEKNIMVLEPNATSNQTDI